MDSLDLIRAFHEIANQGSFSSAAKRLGISKGTASKYIAELESRFGVRLLNRSTRSLSLTDAGELLLTRTAPVLEMVDLTQAELAERAHTPRGRLRVGAPYGVVAGEFPELLSEFMGFYPEVTLSLHLSNEVQMVENGVDVQLRFGPIGNENLIVRRLLLMPMIVCAAPDYWKRRGIPNHPSELKTHDALTVLQAGEQSTWRFEEKGKAFDVRVRSRLESTEGPPLLQVAMRGHGVIYVPALIVQPHVERGELVPVLAEYGRNDMWLWAAYLERKHSSAALRAFLDFLEARINQHGRYAPDAMTAKGRPGPSQ
ncbi:MAG TPA: LysR family transcriptional regulator [Variovorax sp.]|nr:LysR family transcriptional regulator [Variovorax sp.]